MLSAVPIKLPDGREEMAETLREVAVQTEAGEFETVFIIAIQPSGRWLTMERGKRTSRLEMIGLMETLKDDLIRATET